MEKRYLEDFIIADALKARKIAFISGPRQVDSGPPEPWLERGTERVFQLG